MQRKLTQREYAVLEAMARGLSGPQIAAELYISIETVKSRKTRIFAKLPAINGQHAIHVAWQRGILQ